MPVARQGIQEMEKIPDNFRMYTVTQNSGEILIILFVWYGTVTGLMYVAVQCT